MHTHKTNRNAAGGACLYQQSLWGCDPLMHTAGTAWISVTEHTDVGETSAGTLATDYQKSMNPHDGVRELRQTNSLLSWFGNNGEQSCRSGLDDCADFEDCREWSPVNTL